MDSALNEMRDMATGRARGFGFVEMTTDEEAQTDPVTLTFALLRLPDKFVDGDRLPIVPTDRWFDSREEAVAALPELLNREE